MKSISKKIYLLLVLAVMSFCAVLFPMSANTAKAEVAFDLAVTSAQVKVQLAADESGNKEWAIMFKATIDANELAAAEGTEVKFGMLIGPTKLVGDNATHAEFVADGFKTFSHVNSTGIKLAEGATGFDYWAGIRFNEAILTSAENKLAAGAMELTAIPFYQVGEGEIVLGTRKAVESRKVLTQSYGEKSDANEEVKIPLEVVNAYAGQYVEKEAYICKSTDRLMTTTEVNGDLTADAGFSAQDTVFLGKVKGTGEDLTAILDDDLEVNGATTIVAFTADGKAVYMNAKHAERVITRFFYNEAGSNLEDYLGGEKDTTNKPTKGGSHASIWYMKTANAATFDGLYVLANDLVPTMGGTIYNSSEYAGHDVSAGKGFVGTFDGRGKTIDFVANGFTASVHYGGFFSSLYGATVKNVAFEEINNQVASSQSYGAITSGVANTVFENVYVNITRSNNFSNQFNGGLLFGILRNAQNEFKNMIVKASLFNYEFYDKTLASMPGYQTLGSSTDKAYCAPLKSLWTAGGYTGVGGNKSYDNFFAVGTTPLSVSYSTASYTKTPAIDSFTFMSIDEMPYYNDNGTIKQTAIYPAGGGYGYYTLDQFVGTVEANNATDENENDIPDFIEERFKMAQYLLECRFGKLEVQAQLDAGKVVKICFNDTPGAHDFSDAQFASFVQDEANATQLAKFDSAYWVVDATAGTITWKGLSA